MFKMKKLAKRLSLTSSQAALQLMGTFFEEKSDEDKKPFRSMRPSTLAAVVTHRKSTTRWGTRVGRQ